MVNYTEQDLLAAISKVESLHSCAQVLAKAFEILNDPDSNQMDLVDTIKTDSSLTSDILRIANSAFYGSSMEISTLDDSIQRLGFREVMKLISISMSKQMFNKSLDHYNLSSANYWAENASVAATMECFSDAINEDRSFFFTLGILHGIGRLVIDQTLADRGSKLKWDPNLTMSEWETQNFGFDYTDSGHVLLTSWNFPQKILAVILNQITPERVNNPPASLICLNYSIKWRRKHHNFEKDCLHPELDASMKKLGFSDTKIEAIYNKSKSCFADLKKMAGM